MTGRIRMPRAATVALILYAKYGVAGKASGQTGSAGTQSSETTGSATALASADTLRLTLRGAAALAAQRNPAVVVARARVSQSEARVLESRSALLPHVSAYAADGERTMNTATFGIEFPSIPGQPPLFDPNGEVIGPIHIVDHCELQGNAAQGHTAGSGC